MNNMRDLQVVSCTESTDESSDEVRKIMLHLGGNDNSDSLGGTARVGNLLKELNRPQGLSLGAIGLCIKTQDRSGTEKILEKIQLVHVVLSRLLMTEPEGWALARLCGDRHRGPESPSNASFHAELRWVIQKYHLWRFFNASGPGEEHRAIVPSAYEPATGDVLPVEMAAWRAAYRYLTPARQMMVATIVWLYRGSKDSIWLRRVPVAWGVVEAVDVLRGDEMLEDWGVLLARYPGW